MLQDEQQLSETISTLGEEQSSLTVRLSHELIHLLSDQMYQSPLKAIEELVVNSYDADAKVCRVFVPGLEKKLERGSRFIAVFDDGIGMTAEGLSNLWHIGRSNKRTEEIELRSARKQIGKFGIGKLATYSIAHKITHISRIGEEILSVTVDFTQFAEDSSGAGNTLILPIRMVSDWRSLERTPVFAAVCKSVGVKPRDLLTATVPNWTFAILEELKDKSDKIRIGRLQWVLETAMPLGTDFSLFLNCSPITSSKESYDAAVKFNVDELPQRRIDYLAATTGEQWQLKGDALVSPSFPSGVTGSITVTKKTLVTGKSSDIGHSHGFFIRVRGRLINQEDAWFGLSPASYETFYHLRAEINADDLDDAITAPREGLEFSELREKFRALLSAIFNEARQRYEDYLKSQYSANRTQTEKNRNYIPPQLVEYPLADVLTRQGPNVEGAEADNSWFYLNVADIHNELELSKLAQDLYENGLAHRSIKKYKFDHGNLGRLARMVRFDPRTATFTLNDDHELVQAYASSGQAVLLLEDMAAAEALLEVYLRAGQVPVTIVGEVLEHRDTLLRSLATDRAVSPQSVGQRLRDASNDQYELEIALIVAARALGFVATQISGSGEPDGLARVIVYPDGERKITLEAKSSKDIPSLSAIDFAGLHEHMKRHEADGCLLVAPAYPGASREEDAAASMRAQQQRISCWTIDQLATFVELAKTRHLAASDVLEIVLSTYRPDDVSRAVQAAINVPGGDSKQLYSAIFEALRRLERTKRNKVRTLEMISTLVMVEPEFNDADEKLVEQAIRELAAASHGGLVVRDESVVLRASLDEIERRVSGLTDNPGEARKHSSFRGQ